MGIGRKIAIFDLDGTYLKGSSFNKFVKFLIIKLVYLFGEYRAAMKVANIFMSQFISHKSHRDAKCEIMQIADRYFSKLYYVLFTSEMSRYINSKVNKRLLELKLQGYYTILLSASPEQYVKYIGQYNGFKYSAGTPMTVSVDDYIELRGERKAELIRTLLSPQDKVEYIFTDHQDDFEIISLCRGAKAVLVNPSKTLVEMCVADGVDYEIL